MPPGDGCQKSQPWGCGAGLSTVMPGACPAGHSFLRQQFPCEMGIKVCIGDLSSISGQRGKYQLFKAVRVPGLCSNSWRKSLQDTGKSRAEVSVLDHRVMPSVLPLWGLCLLKSPIFGFPVTPRCFLFWAGKFSVIRAVPSVVFPVCRGA